MLLFLLPSANELKRQFNRKTYRLLRGFTDYSEGRNDHLEEYIWNFDSICRNS